MSHNSRQSLDSCTLQLHSWRPFLDSDPTTSYKPHASSSTLTKRPCLSDRSTSFPSTSIPSTFPSSLSLKMTITTPTINPSPLLPADPTSEAPYALSSARGGGEDPVLCPAGAPIEVGPGGAARLARRLRLMRLARISMWRWGRTRVGSCLWMGTRIGRRMSVKQRIR